MSDSTLPSEEFDVAIVGGGMNGATLAIALSGSGLKVAMIESYALQAEERPSYDDRAIALSFGTVQILHRLGIWQFLSADCAPIHHIHVSDAGHFGFSRLRAQQEGVPFLGQVATARSIGTAMSKRLQHLEGLQLFCPATLLELQSSTNRCHLNLRQGSNTLSLRCKLLVAADGGDSPVREQLKIPVRRWEYGHHAITANITVNGKVHDTAFERFTKSGPLALLPLTGSRYAVVWTALDHQVEDILSLSDLDFVTQLQQRFGRRLGQLSLPSRRNAYPLRMMQALEHYRGRVVLIGNAAHTVHPIAGQGFNLGIRDAVVLAELLRNAHSQKLDPGSEQLLKQYVKARNADQHGVTLATDVLARLFTSPLWPLKLVRNLGLLGFDLCPAAKHFVARRAMGLNTPIPEFH